MTAGRRTIRLHAVDFKRLHSRQRIRVECLVTMNAALLKLRYYVTTAARLSDCNTVLKCRDLRSFEIRNCPIRFESDGLIRICRRTTNHAHCSTKSSTFAPL